MDEELVQLPWEYIEPRGKILLARIDGESAGCVAVRPLSGTDCEMRRLYVRSAHRSAGVGHELVEQVIVSARDAGYDRIVLNTLPAMSHALALYRRFGFSEIDPYVKESSSGVIYMGLAL